MIERRRPTRAELEAARSRTVKDVIAPGLDVLFCGINPGLYTAAIGHHFGRPGNRFWPVLHQSGFTPRLLTPYEEKELLDCSLGVTNVVRRTTATAAELEPDELRAGARALKRKVTRYRPRFLAVLGLGAYRVGFGDSDAAVGPRPERLADTEVWVLPNPSGLNAHYQLSDLVAEFRHLRRAVRRQRSS